jgi:hypothetical protein
MESAMPNAVDVVEKTIPCETKAVTSEGTVFHVMFQMDEESNQPWGDVFRGRYSLPAIMEILKGFRKNGVDLKVWFLEDNIGSEDHELIKTAFAAAGREHRACWFPAFPICPMMFAASQGLSRAVGAFMGAECFKPNPDQIVDGRNAMGVALQGGWRLDIAIQLLIMMPSAATITRALDTIEKHRAKHPEHSDLHQGECRDALLRILKKELEE